MSAYVNLSTSPTFPYQPVSTRLTQCFRHECNQKCVFGSIWSTFTYYILYLLSFVCLHLFSSQLYWATHLNKHFEQTNSRRAISRSNGDGSNSNVIKTTDLIEPNGAYIIDVPLSPQNFTSWLRTVGLAIDHTRGRLFISDGKHGIVLRCDLDARDCITVTQLMSLQSLALHITTGDLDIVSITLHVISSSPHYT